MADKGDRSPREDKRSPQSLVTEDEVKKVLSADKGTEAQLISWKLVDFTKKGDNYACVVSSVEVKYALNNEDQNVAYVVKLNPCRNFQEFEHVTNQIFEKESSFYLQLIPELNSALELAGMEPLKYPKCFHCNLEMGKEQIYFEDLRAKEFKMFDKRKGMDSEHVELVLRELARLHAVSYLLMSKSKESFIAKHAFLEKDMLNSSEKDKEVAVSLWKGHLINAIDMLKKVSCYERAVTYTESLVPQIGEILTNGMKSKRFTSVNHGDCWNNNILFRYDDEGRPIDVMLLDLQICREASLAVDLNYFMFTSLTGNVRKDNLSQFLSTYYASYQQVILAGGFQMHFTEEDLVKEFREKNVFGCIFGMIVLPFVVMETNEVPDFSGEDKNLAETMEDLKAKALQMMDTNPLLKPRFLAIFDELMETGVIA